jgi:hypothetical protein
MGESDIVNIGREYWKSAVEYMIDIEEDAVLETL